MNAAEHYRHSYNDEDDRIMETLSTVVSAFSMLGSLYVIITALNFYEQMTRNKLFMQLLALISASNLISNIAGIMGYPKTEDECYAQSFLWGFGSRATWIYATVTSMELLHFMKKGHFFCDINVVSGVGLIVNIIFASIPYMFGAEYGLPSVYLGTSYCKLHGIRNSAVGECVICPLAMLVSVFIPGTLMMFAMMVMSFMLRGIMKENEAYIDEEGKDYNSRIIRQVIVYPIGIILFWAPLMIYFLSQYLSGQYIGGTTNKDHVVFNVCNMIMTMEGMYIATAFFISSKESRLRWKLLFFGGSEDTAPNTATKDRSETTGTNRSRSGEGSFSAYSTVYYPDFLTNEGMAQHSREISRSNLSRFSSELSGVGGTSGATSDTIKIPSNHGSHDRLSFHFSNKRTKDLEDVIVEERRGSKGSKGVSESSGSVTEGGFEMTKASEVSNPIY